MADFIPTAQQAQQLFDQGVIKQATLDLIKGRQPTIDENLVKAVLRTENAPGDPNAISPKGAIGLAQVMPKTGAEVAAKLGIENADLTNPAINQVIGTTYLADQMDRFKTPELAAAAYNAGPTAVQNAIDSAHSDAPAQVLPLLPPETRKYVPKVMADLSMADQPDSRAVPLQQPSPAPATPTNLGAIGPSPGPSEAAAAAPAATDLSGQLDKAFEEQRQAALKATQAGQEQGIKEAAYLETVNAQLQKQQEDGARIQAQMQARIEEQFKKAQAAIDDAANWKVDSGRVWSNMGTGGKIAAAIAIGLSAVGQAYQGAAGVSAPNLALQVIEGAINRDIEEQKANIIIKRENAQSQNSLLNTMRGQLGDLQQAQLATEASMYRAAGLQVQKIAAQSKDKAAQAAGQELFGKINERELQLRAQLQKTIAESPAYSAAVERAALAGAINPAQLDKEQKARLVPVAVLHQGKDGETKPMIVATGGFAADEVEARELRDRTTGYVALRNTLNDIAKLKESEGGTWEDFTLLSGKAVKAKYSALRAKAIEGMKVFGKLGTLDAGVERLADMGLPTVDELMSTNYRFWNESSVAAKLKQAISSLDDQYKTEIQTRIQTPGAAAFGLQQTGAPSLTPGVR